MSRVPPALTELLSVRFPTLGRNLPSNYGGKHKAGQAVDGCHFIGAAHWHPQLNVVAFVLRHTERIPVKYVQHTNASPRVGKARERTRYRYVRGAVYYQAYKLECWENGQLIGYGYVNHKSEASGTLADIVNSWVDHNTTGQ